MHRCKFVVFMSRLKKIDYLQKRGCLYGFFLIAYSDINGWSDRKIRITKLALLSQYYYNYNHVIFSQQLFYSSMSLMFACDIVFHHLYYVLYGILNCEGNANRRLILARTNTVSCMVTVRGVVKNVPVSCCAPLIAKSFENHD